MTSNVDVYPGPIVYVFTVDHLNDRMQSNFQKVVKNGLVWVYVWSHNFITNVSNQPVVLVSFTWRLWHLNYLNKQPLFKTEFT